MVKLKMHNEVEENRRIYTKVQNEVETQEWNKRRKTYLYPRRRKRRYSDTISFSDEAATSPTLDVQYHGDSKSATVKQDGMTKQAHLTKLQDYLGFTISP